MSKSALLVISLAAVLTVFTYYTVPLLVASESLRKDAPHVAASMERMVRGLHGKTLYCTEDETAPKPELITPRQVLLLAEDVRAWIMEANHYDIGVASTFVSDDYESTAAMSRLYAIGGSFPRETRRWCSACESGSVSAEQQKQLDQDLLEMEGKLQRYQIATAKHGRGVQTIRFYVAFILLLDLAVASWLAARIRRSLRHSTEDRSDDTY